MNHIDTIDTLRAAYIARFESLAHAIEFEIDCLSCGRQFLESFSLTVLDGGEATAEYYVWLNDALDNVKFDDAHREPEFMLGGQ